MKLICYPTSDPPPAIIPAPLERDWMGRTSGFAYRCLPLNIANGHGWMILNDAPFFARWDGGDSMQSITIERCERDDERLIGISHFGFGILTFQVNCLFQTPPEYDLFVAGPLNLIKDGIQPLSGIVETDWSPFTFTMNWRFTREYSRVIFERREPICMLFPVKRGLLESVEPEIQVLQVNPQLEANYQAWTASRQSFNRNLNIMGSPEQRKRWQKDYFLGSVSNLGKPHRITGRSSGCARLKTPGWTKRPDPLSMT